MNGKTSHTLSRTDDNDNEIEIDVVIEYTSYRGYAATLEEPGDDGGIEIDSVTDEETGDDIELTELEMDECLQAAADDAYASANDGPDDYED